MSTPLNPQTPLDFICPITQDIMIDPVIDNEGVSYERSAIEEWLNLMNQTSPATNQPLRKEDLRANLALKSQIESYVNGNITINNPTSSSSSSSSTLETSLENEISLSPKKLNVKVTKCYNGNSSNPNENDEGNKTIQMLSLHPPLYPTGCNKLNLADLVHENRNPVTIVCVVDVSGSMDTEGTIQSANGQNESFGLSILDITKHALKTIVSSLGPKDKFSCVTYSDDAKVVVYMGKMTDLRKEQALTCISELRTEGCTNIWSGLKLSLKLMQKVVETNSNDTSTKAIFLLTDGCPNSSPTRGEVYTLKKTIEKDFNNKLPCIINTYGFGYSLMSGLLNEIANCGNGSFSFIPDAGMVGTIFVNSIANIMSSYASNVKLYIEFEENENTTDLENENRNSPLIKQYQHGQIDENNLIINIGNISYGQPINLVLNGQYGNRGISACKIEYFGCESEFNQTFVLDSQNSEEKRDEAVVSFTTDNEIKNLQTLSLNEESEILIDEIEGGESIEIRLHKLRLSIVQVLRQITENTGETELPGINNQINSLKEKFKDFAHESIQLKEGHAIYQDLIGEITTALSNTIFFRRWGKHYLKSLANAHCMQICNNFKDPGVQIYGGEVFEEIREGVDLTFNDLPPPKPSRHQGPRYRNSPSAPTPTFSMASMNCASNGCFTSESLLTIKEESSSSSNYRAIPISGVKKGMIVVVDDKNHTDIVECVVRHRVVSKDSVQVVRFHESGLGITMWHPILLANKKWIFPCELHESEKKTTKTEIIKLSEGEYIYNLVMKNRSNVLVNNVTCCTLAHGLKGSVIEHPFYGTEKVVQNYQALDKDGFKRGLISINDNIFISYANKKQQNDALHTIVKLRRSEETNLVIGFEKSYF